MSSIEFSPEYVRASRDEKKRSARARAHQEQVQLWLESCGWYSGDDGMRHPNLNGARWGWPLTQAAELQKETDVGRQGLVYEMLRGAG